MSASVTDGWGYVAGGYGATAALLGGYVVSVLRRQRVLGRRLPDTAPPAPAVGAHPDDQREEVP